MKRINRKISVKVHTMVKLLASLEQTSVSEIVNRAIKEYKKDFPDLGIKNAPIQNPLIYPTDSRAIVLTQEDSEYIGTLPIGSCYTGIKSPMDRVLIHYQNKSTQKIPETYRVNWLDEQNLKWITEIPEG